MRKLLAGMRLFCTRCGKETWWRLTGEDATREFYRCSACGQSKDYTVR